MPRKNYDVSIAELTFKVDGLHKDNEDVIKPDIKDIKEDVKKLNEQSIWVAGIVTAIVTIGGLIGALAAFGEHIIKIFGK